MELYGKQNCCMKFYDKLVFVYGGQTRDGVEATYVTKDKKWFDSVLVLR